MLKYKLMEGADNDLKHIVRSYFNANNVDMDEYMHIDESCINDYRNLDNIDTAVNCLIRHLDNGDTISILVDPDPDGMTSAAILYKYIKRIQPEADLRYIIHNQPKAHGLADMGKGDFTIPDGTKLLITPDSGTNDIDQLNSLVEKGIDCLVLDHHIVEIDPSFAEYIIVNNQSSGKYTDKYFSGVGIVYEFLRALDDTLLYDYADDYLDLVALGNISDDMSVKEYQTKYYISRGLQNIQNRFLKEFIEAQEYSIKGRVNIHNIQFYVTPILNAIIRIGDYAERVNLFEAFLDSPKTFEHVLPGGGIEIENIYQHVIRVGKNTKSKQDRSKNDLKSGVQSQILSNEANKICILITEESYAGLLGVTAIKVAEDEQKPCLIVRKKDGVMSGSGRNFSGSSLTDFRGVCEESGLFIYAQGHPSSFGVSFKEENLEKIIEFFNSLDIQKVDTSEILCNFIVGAEDLTKKMMKDFDTLNDYYGAELPMAKIAIENISLYPKGAKISGKNSNVLSWSDNGIKYISFDPDFIKQVQESDAPVIMLNAICACEINTYKGFTYPQVKVKKLEIIS